MMLIAGRSARWTTDDAAVARMGAGGWLHGERLGSTVLHAAIDGARDSLITDRVLTWTSTAPLVLDVT